MIHVDEVFDINYVDASSISTFNRCPARYLFSRQLGLSLPEASLIAPDFGTDIHLALPLCYDVDNVDAAMAVFEKAWRARSYGEEDPKRNCIRARAMLEDFRIMHSSGHSSYEIIHFPFTSPTKDAIGDNEVPFLIDIGADLPAAGRIDIPIRWKSTKDFWALDYKTASEISGRYFDNFSFSPQTVLYTLALSQLTNERVSGMIIEALRVSKVNTETQMCFVYVHDHEISSFLRLAQNTAHDILGCNKRKTWSKKCTGCGPYSSYGFPSRICEYYNICKCSDWRAGVSIYQVREPFHPFIIDTGDTDSDE